MGGGGAGAAYLSRILPEQEPVSGSRGLCPPCRAGLALHRDPLLKGRGSGTSLLHLPPQGGLCRACRRGATCECRQARCAGCLHRNVRHSDVPR